MLISELPKAIDDVLLKTLTATSEKIGQNIDRNGQNVTGKTKRSLRVDVGGGIGAILGAGHIDTLEEGITAERSRQEGSLAVLYPKIFVWSQNRGFGWKKRDAFMAAKRQQEVGSALLREGGRKDVYTSEEQPLFKAIDESLDNLFISLKILP